LNEQELRGQLDDLAVAIENMPAAEVEKARLQALIDNIEGQLSNAVVEGEPESLADQVGNMVSGFESDHPTVAGILNNIMVTLTSMGV
jgi:hypothetical protein